MQRAGFRARAARVLAIFAATIVVAGAAPWMDAHGWERVCSVRGERWIDAHEHTASASTDPSAPGRDDDHAAHCALCVPVAAPPQVFVAPTPSVARLVTSATRRCAARVAALVGTPFPPRAPPHLA